MAKTVSRAVATEEAVGDKEVVEVEEPVAQEVANVVKKNLKKEKNQKVDPGKMLAVEMVARGNQVSREVATEEAVVDKEVVDLEERVAQEVANVVKRNLKNRTNPGEVLLVEMVPRRETQVLQEVDTEEVVVEVVDMEEQVAQEVANVVKKSLTKNQFVEIKQDDTATLSRIQRTRRAGLCPRWTRGSSGWCRKTRGISGWCRKTRGSSGWCWRTRGQPGWWRWRR